MNYSLTYYVPLALLGQEFLYVLISYFPILYVLIYTIFSKLWSVDVLFDSAFPNIPICQRLKARSSYGVLFPNYGPLSCFQIIIYDIFQIMECQCLCFHIMVLCLAPLIGSTSQIERLLSQPT